MRKNHDEPIKNILKQFVESRQIKPNLTRTKIVNSWGKLMGTTIANYTKEIYVNKGTLYLYIDSSPLRQELSYSKEKIKNRLNEELGEDYIDKVVIR